jgi:hypothetical protein
MLYWFSGLRLYTELLPFVLLGVAAILAGLRRSRPQLALALFATLIAASSIMSLPWTRRDHDDGRRWSEYGYTSDVPVPMAALVRADSLGRAHNGVVLFVSERTRYDTLLGALYLFNGDGLDGHVLVARDLGDRNAELAERVPGRTAFLVSEGPPGGVPEFRQLPPDPRSWRSVGRTVEGGLMRASAPSSLRTE